MSKILVIEDESTLRSEVVQWLTLEGHQASGAADGVEGVESAFHDLPDLVICDISMPRLDGYGVLLELRANPATMNIPFVFVTARAAYDDVRQGMDLGADDYITKPFKRHELLEAVKTRLLKKEAQEELHRQELQEWQLALEAEREQRMLRAKLVAMFSHDFRNPLSGVLSSSSLLRKYYDRMDESRREAHFDRIEASVKQLVQMIDDMLIVSRMESGAFNLEPVQLDVTDFVEGIVKDFQMIHKDSCEITLESQLPGSYVIDHRLLRQIVTNLISNSVKYSPQDSTIRIFLTPADDSFDVTVTDEGIGRSEMEQDRLSNTSQLTANVGRGQGNGLGLAIVWQAVSVLGGSLEQEAHSGTGTTVTVHIPASAA